MRDNNSDGGVCTIQYIHTNDCSLLITAKVNGKIVLDHTQILI